MATDDDTGQVHGDWIGIGEAPSVEAHGRYWYYVERTLTDVFEVEPEEANRKVQELRRRVSGEAQDDTGTIFFHATPLDVAADLAGRPRDYVVQPAERLRYGRIMTDEREDRPDAADVAAVHPED
jgi:hypothetical protein